MRSRIARIAGVAALAVVFAVALAVLASSSRYEVHALFADASQLVKGDLVQVGGKTIGKVRSITLTSDNQADIEFDIGDDRFKPLRRGAVARVRQVGQIGLTNRYIELDPGPANAPTIPDGGTLPAIQTRPSIDIDVFLDTFDPKIRAELKKLLQEGSRMFAGRTRAASRAFAYLNPALGQSRLVLDEMASDPHAFRRLVTTSSALASALASRQTDLQEGIGNTAAMLRALAAETTAMGDAIGRAPAVMRQGRATFDALNRTLAQLNPALAELRPSAAPLARLLALLPPTARDATPALADLRAVLPPTARTLRGLPALARVAVPALRSTTTAVRAGQPIFTGMRPYAQELTVGISNAFGGAVTGYYDANGHYGRLGGVFNPGPGGFTGPLAVLAPKTGLAGFTGFRSGLTARCPGAVMEPAPDGSNPWVPDSSLCDPQHQHEG